MSDLLVEKNITRESARTQLVARISCKDRATLMDYLKEKGYLSHPMILGSKDCIWSAEVYEKPKEQEQEL